MIVVSIDVAVSAHYDLLDPEKFGRLLGAARDGRFISAHAGPPCGTWSAARYNFACPGPPPLRSRASPWGLDGLSLRLRRQVDVASRLLRSTVAFLSAIASTGGFVSLEHPEALSQALIPA